MTQEAKKIEVPNFEVTSDVKRMARKILAIQEERTSPNEYRELKRHKTVGPTRKPIYNKILYGPKALYKMTRAEYKPELEKKQQKVLFDYSTNTFYQNETYLNSGEFFWTRETKTETPEDFWWRLIKIE